jgi:hypothetical protein
MLLIKNTNPIFFVGFIEKSTNDGQNVADNEVETKPQLQSVDGEIAA